MSNQPADYQRIAPDVQLGRNVRIHGFVNLYGCEIGDETTVGENAMVGAGSVITKDVPPNTTRSRNGVPRSSSHCPCFLSLHLRKWKWSPKL
jgi:acetyltransferase-like isoleucine patch superfamily enzyme